MGRMNASVQMLPDPLPDDPMPLAAAWLKEAWERRALPNPDAMVLATVDEQSRPSARVVLCKTIKPRHTMSGRSPASKRAPPNGA